MSATDTDRLSLPEIVAERPFPEYTAWWTMGAVFVAFMSEAIVSEWLRLPGGGDFEQIKRLVSTYLDIVYGRAARSSLVDEFVDRSFSLPIQSGEFDALSYAFFRSSFECLERHVAQYNQPLELERRSFTKRVGRNFYSQIHNHLKLNLPAGLGNEAAFEELKACIAQVGAFLTEEGYLRDHFRFSFDLDVALGGQRITQSEAHFLGNLERNGIAYALYDMGYPVILPSAVYLFHTVGEAQHHSSRTIEELFQRIDYDARETDDFDPSDHPAASVVELWEIRKLR